MAESTTGAAKRTVYPEDLIWQFVRMRLVRSSGPAEKLPETWLLKQMPPKIELSEEFLTLWQQNVKTAVIRLLIETFGHDPVLLMPDGENPISVTTADRAFWEEARFTFSAAAVDRIWESLLVDVLKKVPAWDDVTPWDAVFFGCFGTPLWEKWSFDWLLKRKADWLAVALFLERTLIGIPDKLPWLGYFQHPREVPFPLRHRLILRTGRFFVDLSRAARLCLAELGRGAPDAGTPETGVPVERSAMLLGSREWQIMKNLSAPARFGRKEILAAMSEWTGDGSIGLHDRRYLDGAAEQAGLYPHMEEFFSVTRDFAAMCGMDASSPQRAKDGTPA